MNELEHLLVILGEECNESGQRASKAIRFGMTEIEPGQSEDNKRRLEREVAEVVAMAELVGLEIREEDKQAKREKVKKFMAYSRELGTLQGDALPTAPLTVIVNGKEAMLTDARQFLTYQDILELAGERPGASVVYKRAVGPTENGTIYHGQAIQVKNGTVINCMQTGNA